MEWVFRRTSYQLNGAENIAENETTIAFIIHYSCQRSFILAFYWTKSSHVKLKKFQWIDPESAVDISYSFIHK